MFVYISRRFSSRSGFHFTPKISKRITGYSLKPSPITSVYIICGLTEVFKKTIFMTIFNALIDASYT